MNFSKAVENIGTVVELKRISSAYVIDYRNLTDDEIKAALIKTAPQYFFEENVRKSIRKCLLHSNREHRTLSLLLLRRVVLEKDNFTSAKRETEDQVIAWEQSIVDRANEDLSRRNTDRSRSYELFQFVLETAWQQNEGISPDEKNLIEKLRLRLRITDTEYRILEAKLGKFPKPGNQIHTRAEIDETRRMLQSEGLLFAIRNNDGVDFDVIPEELAATLRKVFAIEMREYGYRQMLKYKHVRLKPYLIDILAKCDLPVSPSATMEELHELCVDHIKPSTLLGGISPRDGLATETLSKWCEEIGLNVSGLKADLIARIIKFYDGLLEKNIVAEDERAVWYSNFEVFARRDIDFLRACLKSRLK
ncbi:MAG: hypothetical protein H0X66_07070 [Verrucomicrobia bacterium]|nr:hypothetical protein [Verrucomicrobiota bacterium]